MRNCWWLRIKEATLEKNRKSQKSQNEKDESEGWRRKLLGVAD